MQNWSYFKANVQIKGLINPLTTNVSHHIEPSQLICFANQLTGFYMRAPLALNGLKGLRRVDRTYQSYLC